MSSAATSSSSSPQYKVKVQLDEIDEAQHVYQTNVIKLRQRLINEAIQGKKTKSEDSDESVDELLKLLSISNTKGKKRKQLEAIDTEEIPFAIPEKWRWVRLQTICSKIVDGDHNPPTGLKNNKKVRRPAKKYLKELFF